MWFRERTGFLCRIVGYIAVRSTQLPRSRGAPSFTSDTRCRTRTTVGAFYSIKLGWGGGHVGKRSCIRSELHPLAAELHLGELLSQHRDVAYLFSSTSRTPRRSDARRPAPRALSRSATRAAHCATRISCSTTGEPASCDARDAGRRCAQLHYVRLQRVVWCESLKLHTHTDSYLAYECHPRRAHLRVIVAKAAARVEGALAQASRCL